MSLGLTAFAALMGDAGAAAGEPLESYRATTESTGVPELSPLGRQALAQMLSSPMHACRSATYRICYILYRICHIVAA